MSEDKSDGKTINLNALPSCIDEPVKEVLTPGAKEIGGFFGDLLSLATFILPQRKDVSSRNTTYKCLKKGLPKS